MGYIPFAKKTNREKQYDRDWENQFDTVDTPISDYEDYRGFHIERKSYFKENSYEKSIELNSDNSPEKSPRKPRGRNGMTSYNRRTVRNSAFLLQQKYGKKRLGFLTLTLPSLRLDKLMVLAFEWSELMRQFGQEMSRELKRKDRKFIWTGVTEIQTQRLKNRGEPGLHIHIVFVSHDGDRNWYITANRVREIWGRLIENILVRYMPHESHEIDTSASVDLQSVKKDAEAYLGKYISKNKEVVQDMIDAGFEDCLPSAWAHGCNELKRVIKSLIIQVPLDIKTAVCQHVNLVERGVVIYLKEITRENKLYGWAGKLVKDWRNNICSFEYNLVLKLV
jgi:hypothetical protein